MKKAPVILALALLALASPAMAQDQASITLQAQGNVMVSSGGEFVTAATGTQLEPGYRLMVSEGAVARVIYQNNCDVTYDDAGVYSIQRTCRPAAVVTNGTDWGAAGIIAGTAVVGAAILNSMDETEQSPDAPPISR